MTETTERKSGFQSYHLTFLASHKVEKCLHNVSKTLESTVNQENLENEKDQGSQNSTTKRKKSKSKKHNKKKKTKNSLPSSSDDSKKSSLDESAYTSDELEGLNWFPESNVKSSDSVLALTNATSGDQQELSIINNNNASEKEVDKSEYGKKSQDNIGNIKNDDPNSIENVQKAQIALQAQAIQQHLQETRQQDLIPIILGKSSINFKQSTEDITNKKAKILDLRDLKIKRNVPSKGIRGSHGYASLFIPPDEFDWFSRDKFGRIMSTPEACEIFAKIKNVPNITGIEEFYLNARRGNYWSQRTNAIANIHQALQCFYSLRVLVLRGLADDSTLNLIGHHIYNLVFLDVSGSKFVTDEGIKNLFLSRSVQDHSVASSYCLISSWVRNNPTKLNPIFKSLKYFDHSWTNVTHVGRSIVSVLPGSFIFKRMFTPMPLSDNESSTNYAYGHHIFIHQEPNFSTSIPSLDYDSVKFEADLQNYAGPRGVRSFMRLLEGHLPWRNCHLSVFIEKAKKNEYENWILEEFQTPYCHSVILPSPKHRRIYGHVLFACGDLTQLYSIYPLNVNLLGTSCPKLEVLRGILTDSWRYKTSLFQDLTELDMFSEPKTLMSVLQFCPKIKKLRVRILNEKLYDEHINEGISNAMCKRTLEELWIAPSYKTPQQKERSKESSASSLIIPEKLYAKESNKSFNPDQISTKTASTSTKLDEIEKIIEKYENVEERVVAGFDDLVQLSKYSVHLLLKSCPKLKRLGDVAWWSRVEDNDIKNLPSNRVDNCTDHKVSFSTENYNSENEM